MDYGVNQCIYMDYGAELTGATYGCMAAGQSPLVQARAAAYPAYHHWGGICFVWCCITELTFHLYTCTLVCWLLFIFAKCFRMCVHNRWSSITSERSISTKQSSELMTQMSSRRKTTS